jgi:hypothetical protein
MREPESNAQQMLKKGAMNMSQNESKKRSLPELENCPLVGVEAA